MLRKTLRCILSPLIETQVKEFNQLIEMSFPSTTSCRQKWACPGLGQSPVQTSRAQRGAEQVGMAAADGLILPDASGSWGFFINRSSRIHLKKRPLLPILVSKNYRSVAWPVLQKHPALYSAIRTPWIFSSSESHDTSLKPPQMQMKLNHKSKPLEKIKLFICKRGKIIKYISSKTFPSALTFTIEQNNKTYSSLVFPLRIQSKQLIVDLFPSLCRKKYFCFKKTGQYFQWSSPSCNYWRDQNENNCRHSALLWVQFSHVQVENRSQIINWHLSSG